MKLKVKVKPNSKKQEIRKIKDGYEISLRNKAEKNKANIELIKIMKKYLGKEVKIIRGFVSKEKILECQ